ncbi:MAG: S-layer homology domain-containing protein [Pseudanabaena sp. ELA748]
MKIKLTKTFGIAGLTAISVIGCQGSNLGSSLENAIAPASPSNSEPIAEKPTPITSPKASPVNPINSVNTGDRLASQMEETALASLNLTTPKTERISLKSLFYINFNNSQTSSNQFNEFSDLATAPASLRDWLQDLNKLGTISPKTGQEFSPNILISRREYSRWLLETNNRLYQNQPSRQIRLAESTDSPSFPDIPNKHPDFAVIQGLANAGLINGTGDRFRPNDPLLREELVQWKIPLDLRQPLPNATLENINQSWGFKDGDRINENALSAIFADSQLRDLSNIRRSFGFTTLLQPQKPVTRAEAAASLWYFGTATDGISVRKALENK